MIDKNDLQKHELTEQMKVSFERENSTPIILPKFEKLYRLAHKENASRTSPYWMDQKQLADFFERFSSEAHRANNKNPWYGQSAHDSLKNESKIASQVGLSKFSIDPVWTNGLELAFLVTLQLKSPVLAYKGRINKVDFYVDKEPYRYKTGVQHVIPIMPRTFNNPALFNKYFFEFRVEKLSDTSWFKRFQFSGHHTKEIAKRF